MDVDLLSQSCSRRIMGTVRSPSDGFRAIVCRQLGHALSQSLKSELNATEMLLQLLPPSLSPATSCRQWPRRPLTAPPIEPISRASRVACAGGVDDYHATLRALNSKGRTCPRKSLGQHYMLNSAINEQLASVAEVREGDVVLEIGPGTGSLTNVLITSGATIVAVEKDPNMAMLVKERFEGVDRLLVLQEDFTKCHIRSHLSPLLEKARSAVEVPKHAKVVSNLPFNISTDVVKQLLPMGDLISDVVLLLQDETALRLIDASLGTPEYRPINVFVNFYSYPEYKFKVPRTNFFPQPNVDGAVVRFKLKQTKEYPAVTSAKSFFSMVVSYVFFLPSRSYL